MTCEAHPGVLMATCLSCGLVSEFPIKRQGDQGDKIPFPLLSPHPAQRPAITTGLRHVHRSLPQAFSKMPRAQSSPQKAEFGPRSDLFSWNGKSETESGRGGGRKGSQGVCTLSAPDLFGAIHSLVKKHLSCGLAR